MVARVRSRPQPLASLASHAAPKMSSMRCPVRIRAPSSGKSQSWSDRSTGTWLVTERRRNDR